MSLQWGLCILIVASATCQSKGVTIAPTPDLFLHPPQGREASSPAQLAEPETNTAPSSASSPKEITPTTSEAAPPSIHSAISPIPSPSDHVDEKHKWPRNISPSVDSGPNGPSVAADDSFYPTPPPKSNIHAKTPIIGSPLTLPHAPAPARSFHPTLPRTPPIAPPVALAPHAIDSPGQHTAASPTTSIGSSTSHEKSYGVPVASPPRDASKHFSPVKHSHSTGSSPTLSPPHEAKKLPVAAHAPIEAPFNPPAMPLHPQPPATEVPSGPKSAPVTSKHQRKDRKRVRGGACRPSMPPSPPSQFSVDGPGVTPAPELVSRYRQRHHAPPPVAQDPFSPTIQAPVPSPSSAFPSGPKEWSSHSPKISSSASFPWKPKEAPPPMIWSLPPPPPNLDCKILECSEPLTNPTPGSPCVCVWPIKVAIRLHTTVYSFFPLVSEFAQEISSGMVMKQSQVRIMGANIATEEPEDTIVLVHLVPLGEKFDYNTAFSAYQKFWHKQILIKPVLFGDYDVLYVLYPGLPPSPPAAPVNINVGDGSFGNRSNSRTIKPLGVDVRKPKEKINSSIIAVIVLSSFVAFTLCVGAAWILMLRHRDHSHLPAIAAHRMLPLFAKSSGTRHIMLGNRSSPASTSASSGLTTYTGSAKTFTLAEIERATDDFGYSRIIGEGGFGLVYQGTLEDGMQVAVKVLKRDDLQGGREFLAEVEMLSRLHHRNLVKLIGICTEEHARCLVYELIPNGSVESHLHGKDKETSPLDWNARLKIALGAARGLAYLHEDSNPRVIHRDFKSSNILLEHDYTPKVSDFGLARAALDEGKEHISTRVMGTFGYVAPEYAMTGHLLVKSDVYSYGVVLLELLTGRKPVDMLRPPGQENLVSWARPLLTSKDGLEIIVDPVLQADEASDSIAKVAAIASMCVQPEVSHRPFMGEVVQALKLVCNECDEERGPGGCSQDSELTRINLISTLEAERALLASDIFGTSLEYVTDDYWLFQRHSSSGPLRTGKSKQYWQRIRSLSKGSMSDHGVALTIGANSENGEWRSE